MMLMLMLMLMITPRKAAQALVLSSHQIGDQGQQQVQWEYMQQVRGVHESY